MTIHLTKWRIFFIVSILVVLFVLVNSSSGNQNQTRNLTIEDCVKLGSNERAELCLQEVEKQAKIERAQYPNLSNISLVTTESVSMTGNTYYVPNPTIHATIRNNAPIRIFDPTLKITFVKDQSRCEDGDNVIDTQYVTFYSIINAGDTLRVESVVPTNADTSGVFQACYFVVSAKVDR